MEKQKKSFGTIALVVLLLVVTVVSLVLATYAWAKYTSNQNTNATADIAKWNVNFTTTAGFTTDFEHVVSTKVAPGTSGQFTVQIDPGVTEVDFFYKIYIASATNKPAHLTFYADSGKTTPLTIGIVPTNTPAAQTGLIYDTYTGSATSGDAITKTIYWDWPYEDPSLTEEQKANATDTVSAYDAQDVADSNKEDMVVTIKAVATQIQPAKPAANQGGN